MAECKYYKQVRQVSYDNGVTWISLDEYQKGDLYENDSPDCGGGITQYKWVNVSGEYTCVGTTKYQKTKKQQSTDGGRTWTDVNPPEYNTGAVIERESSDCSGGGDYENQYLTLVARGNGEFKKVEHSETFQYSRDEGNTWYNATSATTISVSYGDRVMFKGTLTPSENWPMGVGQFSANTQFEAEGNVMSLLYGDDFREQTSLSENDYILYRLFYGCSGLTSIDNLRLVATTLVDWCYNDMFVGCTSLTTIPNDLLPATTLAEGCYCSMFEDCTSLRTAPNLLATTLASRCYHSMFAGCTSLTSIPSGFLPATTLAQYCYAKMFAGCTSLTTALDLPATRLRNYCYQNMFQGCTSLRTAPVLSATTLGGEGSCYGMFKGCTSLATAPVLLATTMELMCYEFMFSGCTSLTTAPNLPATILESYCYANMFQGCTSLRTAPNLPVTTLESGCYRSMFAGCTSLTTAPNLPATTLAQSCYEGMFSNCSSLNYIKCLATDISPHYCTHQWVDGVAASGTFVKSSSMSGWSSGVSGIPTNWTVQNA